MTMPASHRKQLKNALTELQAVVNLHEILASKDFSKVIEKFHRDPEARKDASRNIRTYLKRHKVPVRNDVIVRFTDNNWCVDVGVGVHVLGMHYLLGVHYDSHGGWGWGGCG
jgi:hypothetical protein